MKALTIFAGLAALTSRAFAQSAPGDLTARLREALPAPVAERVIATASEARSSGLPAAALERRALMLAAKGVEAGSIARSVSEHSRAMGEARAALALGRAGLPADADVAAGAEALRKGVDGSHVSVLARAAPSGRSLAVPLFVLGSLVDRGLPADAALARVIERMSARATDTELSRLPARAAAGRARADAARAGNAGAALGRPAGAGGAGAAGAAAARGGARGAPPPNVPPAASGRGRPAGRGRP